MRDQAISRQKRPRRRADRSVSAGRASRFPRLSIRGFLRVFSLFTYVTVLILGGWLLYYSVESPYFGVQEISVSGTGLLEPNQVQEAAGVAGKNLLLVQVGSVEQSVARLSAVKDVRADVALTGRVSVEIAERTPLVQWKAREGSFLVDGDGVVFSQRASPAPVPVVRDLDGPSMEVGSRVDPSILAAVSQLDGVLPGRAGITPVWYDYSRSLGIGVPVEDGPRIVFGDASDLDNKLSALAAIREHLEATKSRAELIDLRYKGRPTYVLAPPAPVKPAQNR